MLVHLFHSVAVVSRMSTLILNDTTPIQEFSKEPVSAFLPSVADCVAICENFVVLASRVIVDNLPHFAPLRLCS